MTESFLSLITAVMFVYFVIVLLLIFIDIIGVVLDTIR